MPFFSENDEFVAYIEMPMILDDYSVDPSVADACHWNPYGKGFIFSVKYFLGYFGSYFRLGIG